MELVLNTFGTSLNCDNPDRPVANMLFLLMYDIY